MTAKKRKRAAEVVDAKIRIAPIDPKSSTTRFAELQEIAGWAPPILSVYLNTRTPNASQHPRVQPHLAWFKKEAVSLARHLTPHDVELFRRQAGQVERFLIGRHPAETALAIFAGEENWELFPLRIGIENELHWGKPSVGQLLRLQTENRASCVVVVDHHGALFFQYSLGELTLLEETSFKVDVSQWKTKDFGHISSERIRKTRGPNRDLYEDRLKAQYARLCQEAAEQAGALCNKHDLAGLILVGPDRLLALVQAKIPNALAGSVIPVPEDLGNLSSKKLLRRLQPVLDECQRKQQFATVTHLLGTAQGTVITVDETLAQLQNGAIRTLVLVNDLDLDLHQCVNCGKANRFADPVCAACGGGRRKTTLWEILPELLATFYTKLEIVSGEAAQILARTGGMGGWLRLAKRAAAG